ncbi:TetR/AcrR family transcriptional regulator [Nocardia sp. NBC_01327]|uniref:TetR/AcrR family transcriptional regulator n=1 Tax=Nocardia sp. NBC_01327 TaxID=2903593 RepID=UPI002E0E4A7E|nr:TetR/AcrR family transcriptional regulator [Nocardia sp. NBC_01327]
MDLQNPGKDAHTGTPIWARPKPQRRPTVTRDDIVTAAMNIADEEGFEAVSMRRVASRLGVGPMALYTHIDSKDDLLDLIADALAGKIVLSDDDLTEDWRESITRVARRERAMIKQHPWAIELFGKRRTIGPNAMLHSEQSLKALDGLDSSPAVTIQIVKAVDQYTTGFVLRETLTYSQEAFGLGSAAGAYMRDAAVANGYRRLTKLLQHNPTELPGNDESFERGLRWLLEGIERDITGR